MLKIQNYTKIYDSKKVAVDNLSLEVSAGDMFGFIGHNGAGKSTTIKAVAGILNIDKGDIFIDGQSIKTNPIECKQKISYIPDNPDLYDYLTGLQFLNLMADFYSVSSQKRKALIEKYSKMLGIDTNLGDLIGSYSHGMKQKLAIVGALIHTPKLMILDEPFVGLDPVASYNLKEIMSEICANGGAIFFSTHVLEVAEKICNKIAIIRNGRLVVSGETASILKDGSLEDLFLELDGTIKKNEPTRQNGSNNQGV